MAVTDTKPGSFPKLSWEQGRRAESLHLLYGYVTDQAEASQNWYLRKRSRKKLGGFALRLGAMFAAFLAGLIPVLAEILKKDWAWQLNTMWSTVVIAIAALLIAVDRLGGMTSGWVRYMLTWQEISGLEEAFRIEWELTKLQWKETEPSQEECIADIGKCGAFLRSVNEAVSKETKVWAVEFRAALKEIDKATEGAAKAK